MKIKYSGPPFHHFKVGIITPGVQEIEDEWGKRLIEAGIVESGSPATHLPGSAVPPDETENVGAILQGNPATTEESSDHWVEGLAQPVAQDVLEEAEKTSFDSPAPELKRKRRIDKGI